LEAQSGDPCDVAAGFARDLINPLAIGSFADAITIGIDEVVR